MAGFLVKTRKVGGSVVVTLPKELVETQNIKENQCVEITVKKCRKNGFGMFKGMAPFPAEERLKGQLDQQVRS
jgi:bifunctional DNA-binding transcriptional regulator/antitoxin component of YhaV-PrlF toxin-antitoxin module